jgi:hypothetical protein
MRQKLFRRGRSDGRPRLPCAGRATVAQYVLAKLSQVCRRVMQLAVDAADAASGQQ